MTKPKIIVAGSSWARGEWAPNDPVVQHDGIKQYFADAGYTVVDSSQARSYHSRVITFLKKKLESNYVENDIVLFIMADPLLDIIMPELGIRKRSLSIKHLPGFTKSIEEAGGLINLIRRQQDHIYSSIDAVAKQYNTVIHCIGGTYNVNTNISKSYSNLSPLLVSWIHLLVGNLLEHQHSVDPEFGISYTWGINYIGLDSYTPDFAEQVRQEFKLIEDSTRIMDELIFHPDSLHPNREGHKILFDYIVKELNL
jgi:hypothetical protein